MVDPSLLRQAADRGVTICFADLDGADGLWVPEERTVLVSRGLSEERVAEVIEHELAHVMIDDQHADLDAGKDVVVGKSGPASRRPTAAVLAAASLVVLLGGVTYGVNRATGTKLDRVAPPDGHGLTADESGDPRPTTTVIRSVGPDGQVVYRTVTLTEIPAVPIPTVRTSGSPSAVPSATRSIPRQTRQSTAPPRTTTSPAPAPPAQTSSDPVVTTPPQPTVTEPSPTTPPDESGAAGEGGLGDGSGEQGGTGLGTGNGVVDATAADAGDAAPADASTP